MTALLVLTLIGVSGTVAMTVRRWGESTITARFSEKPMTLSEECAPLSLRAPPRVKPGGQGPTSRARVEAHQDIKAPSQPYVPRPRPANSRTAGLLAELSGKQAVIAYRDVQGNETRRRIAIWYLTGLRERAGDTVEGIEAWCYLRNAPRTFYVWRIGFLLGEDGITPAASPEDWLRKQAGFQLNPPPPFIADPPAPAEIVLFDGLSFGGARRLLRDGARS